MPVDLLTAFRPAPNAEPVDEVETIQELEARARRSADEATGLTAAVTGAIASLGLELIPGGSDQEEAAEAPELETDSEDDG